MTLFLRATCTASVRCHALFRRGFPTNRVSQENSGLPKRGFLTNRFSRENSGLPKRGFLTNRLSRENSGLPKRGFLSNRFSGENAGLPKRGFLTNPFFFERNSKRSWPHRLHGLPFINMLCQQNSFLRTSSQGNSVDQNLLLCSSLGGVLSKHSSLHISLRTQVRCSNSFSYQTVR